jgi:galactokinase
MDPMAASLADDGTALFLDTQSLAWERVPLPASAELVVIDSGIAHAHASGGYNARRAECERAASVLGVASLREIGTAGLSRRVLPAPLDRRVRHVVTENDRVRAAVAALRGDDGRRLGALFVASHASMRDDFEVFGGAVLVLARARAGAAAGQRVVTAYAARSGRAGRVLVPSPGQQEAGGTG